MSQDIRFGELKLLFNIKTTGIARNAIAAEILYVLINPTQSLIIPTNNAVNDAETNERNIKILLRKTECFESISITIARITGVTDKRNSPSNANDGKIIN